MESGKLSGALSIGNLLKEEHVEEKLSAKLEIANKNLLSVQEQLKELEAHLQKKKTKELEEKIQELSQYIRIGSAEIKLLSKQSQEIRGKTPKKFQIIL